MLLDVLEVITFYSLYQQRKSHLGQEQRRRGVGGGEKRRKIAKEKRSDWNEQMGGNLTWNLFFFSQSTVSCKEIGGMVHPIVRRQSFVVTSSWFLNFRKSFVVTFSISKFAKYILNCTIVWAEQKDECDGGAQNLGCFKVKVVWRGIFA